MLHCGRYDFVKKDLMWEKLIRNLFLPILLQIMRLHSPGYKQIKNIIAWCALFVMEKQVNGFLRKSLLPIAMRCKCLMKPPLKKGKIMIVGEIAILKTATSVLVTTSLSSALSRSWQKIIPLLCRQWMLSLWKC